MVSVLDGVMINGNDAGWGVSYFTWGAVPNSGAPMDREDMTTNLRAWGRHHNNGFNITYWDGHVAGAKVGEINVAMGEDEQTICSVK
ncbi:hypothetical protein SDC9_176013 [bioreactor metagenome]|uniref:Uncharacterized protein n=1 Tax=bioreactor metagenome TaxID=1076179 RepID=A0A645GNS5_9ZZZZ